MKATVYSKPNCPFCDQAKQLLKQQGITFNEVHFDVGQLRVEGLEYVSPIAFRDRYPDAKTAPQVFIDDVRIGGFIQLREHLSKWREEA